MSKSVEKEIIIKNKLGIHARPAAMLVQLANKFKSDICVCKDSDEVNAKSIIGIMTLAANYGSRLKSKLKALTRKKLSRLLYSYAMINSVRNRGFHDQKTIAEI